MITQSPKVTRYGIAEAIDLQLQGMASLVALYLPVTCPPEDELDGIATVVGKQGDSPREALVIKVLDRKYSYIALSHKLRVVWRIKEGFILLNVGFGYFLVKFDVAEDCEKVMLGGPWLIEGHYVAVKPWDVDFQSSEQSFDSTLVWIQVSNLPIWCYQEQAMLHIAAIIEVPVKVDLATKLAERGRYIRACVQINLGLSVIKNIIVEGVYYNVEYESLTLLCEFCARYAHDKSQCLSRVPMEEKRVDSVQGEAQGCAKSDSEIQNSGETKTVDLADNLSKDNGTNLGAKSGDDSVPRNGANGKEACGEGEAGWHKVLKKEKLKLGHNLTRKAQGPNQTCSGSGGHQKAKPQPSRGSKKQGVRVGHTQQHASSSSHTPATKGLSIRKCLHPVSLQNSPVGGMAGEAPVLESPAMIPMEKGVASLLVPVNGVREYGIVSTSEKERMQGGPESAAPPLISMTVARDKCASSMKKKAVVHGGPRCSVPGDKSSTEKRLGYYLVSIEKRQLDIRVVSGSFLQYKILAANCLMLAINVSLSKFNLKM
ncbi:uncharacterized protein LOC107647240 [Arachis ipaensis]|uniref:uncharacterized protein LOC107647240 n=1 Tax=Arachis ipaensis TaxID=130454 RepID=UPI0007AF6E5B|nr:uncharacterized protein LOC107647240 [Arachis ipaensis]XP_025661818.1 uncharacterized protein LOC112757450 [Arachis hypogaea]